MKLILTYWYSDFECSCEYIHPIEFESPELLKQYILDNRSKTNIIIDEQEFETAELVSKDGHLYFELEAFEDWFVKRRWNSQQDLQRKTK